MSAIDQLASDPIKPQSGAIKFLMRITKVAPFEGGRIEGAPGVTRIPSAHGSFYLVSMNESDTEYILIDTGSDKKATAILEILHHRGTDKDAVKAIFITHAHSDHTSGLRQFPNADIYISDNDREVLSGNKKPEYGMPLKLFMPKQVDITPTNNIRIIHDGETVTIGTRQIRAFAVPGHTVGNMVYLIGEVLFAGDMVSFTPDGRPLKLPAFATGDTRQAVVSAKRLVERFETENIHTRLVIPSHSNTGKIENIKQLAE